MADYSKDKTTERDIVMQTIMDLRQIAQMEFKGGYMNKTISGSMIIETYIEDSRRKYCQLVDFLSDILLPYYDGDIKKSYTDVVGRIDELITKKNEEKINDEDFMADKLRLSRRLLQHLFLLLRRLNWLKKKQTVG